MLVDSDFMINLLDLFFVGIYIMDSDNRFFETQH